MNPAKAVEAHYTKSGLEEKILQALARAGKNVDELKAEDLAPVDEFHVGGLESTKELASLMNLRRGMHLLDVGSGIGGPARYFAAEHGCRVTGVDLTEEFVQVAQSLTRRMRLEGAASFQRASALDLPFEAGTFDGAYMIHVGMNIEDKAGVFREVARVLKSGARFTVFDFVSAGKGEFAFPVPWAESSATSFVVDAAAYRAALKAAGFVLTHERGRRKFAIEFMRDMLARAAQAQGAQPALGLQLLMGEKTPVMMRNVLAAIEASVLEPVEIIGEKS